MASYFKLSHAPKDIDQRFPTFNPIQDGKDAKRSPTSFSSATSGNVRVSPKIFLTFSFNAFATLV